MTRDPATAGSMRVVVSGASGMVGSALAPALERAGHEVMRLVRRPARTASEIPWDPAAGTIDASALEGVDALIHLSGENLTSGRWTSARKQRLVASRVRSTALLAETLVRLDRGPRVLLTASAIGYYGNRADERLSEASPAGDGFLADLVQAWEDASTSAERSGIRVVRARFGLILSPRGGVLARMLPPFRLGLGGPIADGKAWWSWIAIEDLVAALQLLIERDEALGAFNLVAPHPVTNAVFTETLGSILARPTWFRVPAGVLRLVFGEMADQALLSSLRVEPVRLLELGFTFRFPEIEAALRHALAAPNH